MNWPVAPIFEQQTKPSRETTVEQEMATLTCYSSYYPSKSSLSFLHKIPNPSFLSISKNPTWKHQNPIVLHSSNNFNMSSLTLSESEYETETESEMETESESETEDGVGSFSVGPVKRKRRRYRKQYPGEKKGLTEELRFVAMKLKNSKVEKKSNLDEMKGNEDRNNGYESVSEDDDDGGDTWQPSIEGFIKYLVDSKVVFSTIERIVDESSDVSYAYFRRTGLERAECISNDLEWLSQQGHAIPEPSNAGVSYANYLEELAEKTPPLFLCHFYNIYFSHIAGGQVIAKKAFEKLLEEKELEFYKWEGDAEESLRGVREKLNMLAKHWSRDDKNKCLREATKAFRFLGQIVRLIIL